MNVCEIFKEAELFYKKGIAIFCRISYYMNLRGAVICLIFGERINLFLSLVNETAVDAQLACVEQGG